MRQKTFLLSLIICIFSCTCSFAQNSPEDLAGKFFSIYRTDGSDKAIDYIFSTSKYASDISDDISNLKVKLRKFITGIGEYWGYDLVSKKSAGENYIMLTYLVRHDRTPVTFRMLFYKPRDKWQVNNFKFDNKTDDDLETSSRFY